jgi:membrane-associated protease RseP (regulator of RpoE activity)
VHVTQYRNMGIDGFAALYAGPGARGLEDEAYSYQDHVQALLPQGQALGPPQWQEQSVPNSNVYPTWQDFHQAAVQLIPPNHCGQFSQVAANVIDITNICRVGLLVTAIYLNGQRRPCVGQVCFFSQLSGHQIEGDSGQQNGIQFIFEDPWLGVGVQPIPQGVFVAGVQVNSPAAIAGVRPGDMITAFNGTMLSGPSELSSLVTGTAPDNTFALGILRDGQFGSLRVQTGSSGRLGVRVQPIPQGVFVAAVYGNSPAAIAGVRPGDTITAFNGTMVNDPADLVLLVSRTAPYTTVRLQILRNGQLGFVQAQIGSRQ